MIKQAVATLKITPLPEAVQIPFVAQFIDDDGALRPNDIMETSAVVMLDELVRWTDALASLREQAGSMPPGD
jgi:hypothetical protein